ncbi:MAG: hypothetical protein ACHWZW_17775 [Spirulina sp.]
MTRRVWLSLSALALSWGGVWGSATVASVPLDTLQRQMKTAVCLNDWDTAVDRTSAMIASPDLSAQDRQDLVTFRHTLQRYQEERLEISGIPGCEAHLAQYLETVPTPSQPLLLDRALLRFFGEPDLTPDQLAQQINATRRAGLLDPQPTDIPALSPALLVGTPRGSGVIAGEVSAGVEVFTVVGGQGDRVTVDLNVTRILPGLRFTDDDSQLYLFDSQGYLVASNDDFNGLQSRLDNILLPSSGLYYIAVTTFNNSPQLSPNGQLLGWSGDGGSFIEYTLTVTGLTPSGQLALPQVGLQP